MPPLPPLPKSAAYDFEFAYSSFFPVLLKLKWQIRPHTPVIPSKTIPDIYQRKIYGQKLNMFSDRNRAKTIPFWVVCAHTCISLYKGGPAPLRAKKLLVIARLLNLPPAPPKKKQQQQHQQQQQQIYCWWQLLITSFHDLYKAWLRYANSCVAWFSLQGMAGLYRHHWVDQPGYKDRRETLQISQLCWFKNTETTTIKKNYL